MVGFLEATLQGMGDNPADRYCIASWSMLTGLVISAAIDHPDKLINKKA
jgi:hypothetical protein